MDNYRHEKKDRVQNREVAADIHAKGKAWEEMLREHGPEY
jgi:hypothetical protein